MGSPCLPSSLLAKPVLTVQLSSLIGTQYGQDPGHIFLVSLKVPLPKAGSTSPTHLLRNPLMPAHTHTYTQNLLMPTRTIYTITHQHAHIIDTNYSCRTHTVINAYKHLLYVYTDKHTNSPKHINTSMHKDQYLHCTHKATHTHTHTQPTLAQKEWVCMFFRAYIVIQRAAKRGDLMSHL